MSTTVLFPGQGAVAPGAGRPWLDHLAWSVAHDDAPGQMVVAGSSEAMVEAAGGLARSVYGASPHRQSPTPSTPSLGWWESVLWGLELGTQVFIEIGPGAVLGGLIRRTVTAVNQPSVATPDLHAAAAAPAGKPLVAVSPLPSASETPR